jgi:hypothetical protein
MTETDHVSLLRQGKAAWSAWREANPSIHPDQDFLDTLKAHLKGTRAMALFRVWGLIDGRRSLLRVAAISSAE